MAQVSLPYTLQAGQPENVNNLVANLNALVAGVNTIDTAQIAASAVTRAKLGSDVYPYAMAAGANYGGAAGTAITFSSGRFSQTPAIIYSSIDNSLFVTLSNVSSTGFTFTTSNGSNTTINWVAVQNLSSGNG